MNIKGCINSRLANKTDIVKLMCKWRIQSDRPHKVVGAAERLISKIQ